MFKKWFWSMYLVVGILTYGHVYNNEYVNNDERMKGLGTFFAAATFPLYWSMELQRKEK